jgi:predicted transposase YbfD/YdcC
MTVKANQPQLLHDIQHLLAQAEKGKRETGANNPFRPAQVRALGEAVAWKVSHAQSFGLAHGRVERRTLRVLEVPLCLREMWPAVQQVFEVERSITHKKNGKTSCEVVYGVTNLPRAKADAAALLAVLRAHWGIENRSHWIRDVLWQEDQCRAHTGNLPQVLATFRNLALPLLRRIDPHNIAHATRKCAADPMKAFQLLSRTE